MKVPEKINQQDEMETELEEKREGRGSDAGKEEGVTFPTHRGGDPDLSTDWVTVGRKEPG